MPYPPKKPRYHTAPASSDFSRSKAIKGMLAYTALIALVLGYFIACYLTANNA